MTRHAPELLTAHRRSDAHDLTQRVTMSTFLASSPVSPRPHTSAQKDSPINPPSSPAFSFSFLLQLMAETAMPFPIPISPLNAQEKRTRSQLPLTEGQPSAEVQDMNRREVGQSRLYPYKKRHALPFPAQQLEDRQGGEQLRTMQRKATPRACWDNEKAGLRQLTQPRHRGSVTLSEELAVWTEREINLSC